VIGRAHLAIGPESAFFISAGLLCTGVLSVLALPGYWANPATIAPAISIDLSLGLPALGYFFLVRNGRIGRLVLVPLCFLGLLLARWWIPESHLDLSRGLELAAVILEGVLLLALLIRIRRILAAYRDALEHQPYPIDAVRVALTSVIGKRLGAVVFSELGILWYAFAGWRRQTDDHPLGRAFSGHRRSGYPAVLGAILMAVAVETAVMHLLVSLWMVPVAWVLTALGVYSMAWLLGDFHAARLNPSILTDSGLHLRTGLRWRTDLVWADILGIHDGAPSEKDVKLTLWGGPDFWIECRDPAVVIGPFGLERRVRFLGLGVDDTLEFREAIQARVPSSLPMP